MPILLQLTDAGLDAVVAAETGGTDAIHIAEVGLTSTPFAQAPTLIALPGEFKRVPVAAGASVSPNIIHITAYDTSADTYDVTGIGLFLADGTLFATYTGPAAVLSKAALAFGLLAFDIAFSADISAQIDYGNPAFLYPPATEQTRGTAKIATNALADAGVDDSTIMTPKKVKRVIDAFAAVWDAAWLAFQATINAAIAAIQARSITGGGLAAGGGDLTADRIITVPAAVGADIDAGTAQDKAVTPYALTHSSRSIATSGYVRRPDGLIEMWGQVSGSYSTETQIAASFPVAFPTEVLNVEVSTDLAGATSTADFWVQLIRSSVTTSGFSVQSQSLSGSSGSIAGFSWRAIGR